jgi:hypothetical protein
VDVEGTDIEVNIYPNPSRNQFTVQMTAVSPETILAMTVLDMQGRVVEVLESRAQHQVAFGGDYAPGVYLLSVTAGSRQKTFRIIKTD